MNSKIDRKDILRPKNKLDIDELDQYLNARNIAVPNSPSVNVTSLAGHSVCSISHKKRHSKIEDKEMSS